VTVCAEVGSTPGIIIGVVPGRTGWGTGEIKKIGDIGGECVANSAIGVSLITGSAESITDGAGGTGGVGTGGAA
jgi:hypothetical protein